MSLSEVVRDKEKSYGEMRFPLGSCLCACNHPGLAAPSRGTAASLRFGFFPQFLRSNGMRNLATSASFSQPPSYPPPTSHPSSLHHPRSLPAAPRISRAPAIALETTRQNTISSSPASLAPFLGRNSEDRLALRHPAWYFEASARARRGQLGRAAIPSALWAKPGVLK